MNSSVIPGLSRNLNARLMFGFWHKARMTDWGLNSDQSNNKGGMVWQLRKSLAIAEPVT
jgi:hypothetical protein